MLSKSQARIFFLGGTIVFGGIFLALTYDSMKQVPKQTKDQNLTENVVKGKELWEKNNCMGCHTLFGEGAYYAPELTQVVKRRGEAWIKAFLKDPQAMFPGERKMVQYNFTDSEINSIFEFLNWCGGVDLNGFPADPPLKEKMGSKNAVAATASSSGFKSEPPAVFSQICIACHSINGSGGVVGPALDQVDQKYSEQELKAWLTDPNAVKPGTKMPKLPLTTQQIESLTSFLLKQESKNALEGDM